MADGVLKTILEEEAKLLTARRDLLSGKNLPISSSDCQTGLALSGGGIRSATFSLGLLQSLSHQKLIPRIDYLSTVSGGSYIGSFLGALFVIPDKRLKQNPVREELNAEASTDSQVADQQQSPNDSRHVAKTERGVPTEGPTKKRRKG